MKMNKFILLAARRSGTTLLIDCLNSHPEIHCVKRAFGLEQKIKNPTPDKHSGGFYLFRTKSLGNRIRYYTERFRLISDFLRIDIFSNPEDTDLVGFRLIYEMSRQYPEIARWAESNDARVVHLIRRNLLKTYISTETAKIHKMRHPREGTEIKTVRIKLDPQRTIAELKKRAAQVEAQRNLFSKCPCHEMYYEDFVNNRREESKSLLRFLGVDSRHALTSNLVKINPDSLEDLVENFDEIRDAIIGTEFKEYLV